MWNLDYRKYEIVHLKDTAIKPWIVDPSVLLKLQKLSSFLSTIRETLKDGKYLNDTYASLQGLYSSFEVSTCERYNLDEIQKSLGLRTLLPISNPFLDYTEFNKYKEETDCLLLTERNLLPQLIGKGSSRHALGIHYQFKGIGRNYLAHGEDYYHSWGGYVSRDALRALLCDKVVSQRTMLGCLKTQALFKYEETFIDKTPLVLALRECDSYRLSQINPLFLSPTEKNICLNSLYERFKTKDLEKILTQVIRHYVHAFSNGVVHRSIGQENLTLDGRFIDTDSIEFNESGDCCPFYIKLSVLGNDQKVLKKNSALKELIKVGDQVRFNRTWLHDLMLMSELTAIAYSYLCGREFEWEKICLNACEEFLPLSFKNWKIFLSLESYARKFYLTSNFPSDVFTWSQEMENLCKDALCTGSMYDYFSHGTIHTFSLGGDTLRETGMNILLKYDLAFWNKEMSWDMAFENWNLIHWDQEKL